MEPPEFQPQNDIPLNRTERPISGDGVKNDPRVVSGVTGDADRRNAVHSAKLGGTDDEDESDWRISVNLAKGMWRLERYSGRSRQWTSYEKLEDFDAGNERLDKAYENSERQRRQKASARIRVHKK